MTDDRLTDLLVEWGSARDRGQDLTAAELCRDCPDLRDELQRRIRHVQALSRFLLLEEDPRASEFALPDEDTLACSMVALLPGSRLSPQQFAAALVESGVMDSEQVESLPSNTQSQDPRVLAGELIRRNKLTLYQARILLDGRDQPLLLDRYLILDEIGSGGMGAVFKAIHRQMDRVVAIKILPKSALDSTGKIKRFQQEIRAAARLHHPNIVVAHDAHESRGIHYLVMEYVPGDNLAQLVWRQGPLPLGKAVGYVTQSAFGLEYAHQQGIIHRDIKPGNLLIGPQGVVKILDLGLARIQAAPSELDNTVRQELTQPGMVMGTAPYLSPEQALDTHAADARSDVYSLGCTLHFLLTGRPLYLEDTVMKTLVAHREKPIPFLKAIRPDVPQELEAVFQKMVAKNPHDRYQTMQAVAEALNALEIPDTDDDSDFEHVPDLPGNAPELHDTKTASDTLGNLPLARPHQAPVKRSAQFWIMGVLGLIVLVTAVILFKLKTSVGTIVVAINQPELAGAEVTVDGERKLIIQPGNDAEPIEVEADEKNHTLKVTKGGFQVFTQEFTVKAGKEQTIYVKLEPLPKSQQGQPGNDRAVAEWIHEQSGNVGLRFPATNDYVAVTPNQSLPDKDFRIETIGFMAYKTSLTNADLKRIRNLPLLTTLTLNGQKNLEGEGLFFLDQLPRLQKVFLLGTGVTDEGLASLTRFPSLTHLHVGGPDMAITDKGLEPLSGLVHLAELQLGECSITDKGLKHLESLEELKLLRIYACPVTQQGLLDFQKAHPDCRIETKVPGFYPLPEIGERSDRRVAELIHAKGGTVGIQDEKTPFKDFPPHDPLPQNYIRLMTAGLDPKVNTLTDDDLKVFENLPDLTTLGLTDQPIGDKGLAQLQHVPNLQYLYLHGTFVTDDGLKELRRFPQIRVLHVSSANGRISDEGIQHLLELKALSTLHLGTSDVTEKGLDLLGRLPNLEELHLFQPQVTQEQLATFHADHPWIRIESDLGVFEADPAKVAAHRNREVAAWVLAKGGTVGISGPEISYMTVTAKNPLPETPFVLILVSLTNANLTDKDFRRFNNLERFGTLMITDDNLTDQALINMGRLPMMEKIYLGDCKITDRGMRELKRFPGTFILHVAGLNNQITDAGVRELLPLKNLIEVRLCDCGITDQSLETLGELPLLRRLAVRITQITKGGLERFHQSHPECAIESNLGNWAARSQFSRGAVAVAQAAPGRSGLESHDRNVAEWVQALGGNVGIGSPEFGMRDVKAHEVLPTQDFQLVTAGFSTPSASFQLVDRDLGRMTNLPELTTLILNSTQITDQALANLGHLPKLDKIYAGGAPLTDKGLAELQRYPKLVSLHLGGTQSRITDKAVVETISQFTQLKELSLVNCQVTDSGLMELLKLPHLNRLILNNTKMTKAGLEAFHRQKPKCQIISELGLFPTQGTTD